MLATATKPTLKRLLRIRVKLCSGCKRCERQPAFSEPLDAWLINQFQVRIIDAHGLWHGQILSRNEYEVLEDANG